MEVDTNSPLSKMVISNVTGDKIQKTYEELFCSEELTRGTGNQLICLSALNMFLSIAAFLGNTLILVALHKESFLHTPSKLLFRCLAITDLCVGLISEPLIVTYWMSVVNERWDICRYAQASIFITGHALCSVSLFTLTAISVDRLIALLLGLRYRQAVTLKRMHVTVTSFWIVSIVGATMYFRKYHVTLFYGYIGTTVCLATSLFCYTKIFLNFRHRRSQVQSNVPQGQTRPLNLARYKRAVSSALWLQLTLVGCYLPYGIVGVLMTQTELSSSIYLARQFALTLVLLNSSLNPILYFWKIKEVRQAVKDIIRQFCCSSRVRSIDCVQE